MTIERLQRSIKALSEGNPDHNLARYIQESLTRHERGLSMERAFEIKGTGAEKQRNRIMYHASLLLPDSTIWEKSESIRKMIVRNDFSHGPIFDLLKSAGSCKRLPKSRERIYKILLGEHEKRSVSDDSVKGDS